MSWSLEELTRHEAKTVLISFNIMFVWTSCNNFSSAADQLIVLLWFFLGEISADRPESVTH